MRTNEMITKIGLGKEVNMLVECYSPRSPDAVVPLDDPPGAPPMVSLEIPPELVTPEDSSDGEGSLFDNVSEIGDRVSVATGAARVSKKPGFGKLRNKVWDSDFPAEVDWYCPAPIAKLALKPARGFSLRLSMRKRSS